jgi:TolB-like protein/predicted Zn-dependent protease
MPEGGENEQTADSAAVASGAVHDRSDAARVFISYASADSSIANAVCSALERESVRCWIAPRDVTPGELYSANIVHAIDTTRVVVLILSQHAADSAHVLREVERASSKRHPILSFRIDLAPLPDGLEYFLNTSQWLDASAVGVDRALPQLVDAVKAALGKPAAAARSDRGPIVATRTGRRPRLMLMALAGIIAAMLGYVAIDRFWPPKRVDTQNALAETTTASPADSSVTLAIPAKSIAVLPFADMSAEKNQEYMADGIAEELLNLLAQVPDLKVIARTSSFAFKGQNVEIAEIAKKLNVAHVLEGSVRTSGDQLRITVQLIRAADSTHIWSEKYDRSLDDIFAVQDEIANAIVQALQIRLSGGTLSRREGGTQNLEAYRLYLRALRAISQNTKPSLDAAEDYSERAIKLDPQYGGAWEMLSAVVSLQTINAFLPAKVGFERARQLAQHALVLSPNLADSIVTLSDIHIRYDWDWAAAEAELRRALEIDPTNRFVPNVAGTLNSTLGRWNEAERHLRAAQVRDPLDPFTMWNLAHLYYLSGRFEESESTYRKLLKLEPGFAWTHGYLAKTLLMQGKSEAALIMVQQEIDESTRLAYLAIVLLAVDRQSEAEEALNLLIRDWGDTVAFYVAKVYAYRGDHDLALEWLERAYRQKDATLTEIVGEHLFKNLASDPRYKAFLRKMNLPENV